MSLARVFTALGQAGSLYSTSAVRAFSSSSITRAIVETPFIPDEMPVARHPETRDVKEARLLYQTRKRGILENCLILSTFFARNHKSWTDAELSYFDKLLDLNDWDIFYMATGKKPVPEHLQHKLMVDLIEHTRNDRKEILKQPDL
eukprot:Colp12_sorted_trinity150504_noHs@15989